MTKVYLNFNEFELGFLTESNGVFVWTPNIDQIKQFSTVYDGAADFFLLDKYSQNTYPMIPYHFNEFLEYTERADIVKKAQIKQTDSNFEKLCKLAKLEYLNQQFVIKVK